MDRIPQAYGYARVSDNRQADRDDSIPQQVQRCKDYYTLRLESDGIGWQGVEADSFGVSASKRSFAMRPAGIRLLDKLRPGDHLIFDKPDRVWRSLGDYVHLCEQLKCREINVHFVSMGLDTSTTFGEFALGLLVLVAELESRMNGDRVRASNAVRRKEGRPTGGAPVLGTHTVMRGYGKQRKKYRVWHEGHRAVMAHIVQMRISNPNWSWQRISDDIEGYLAAKAGRSFNAHSAFQQRYWTPKRCYHGFCNEVYLRDMSINSTCDIPLKMSELSVAYCRKIELV